MIVVTLTDRPKAVRNLFVVKVLVASLCFLLIVLFSGCMESFAIGMGQISVFFSKYQACF